MRVPVPRFLWVLLGAVVLAAAGGLVFWLKPWQKKSPPVAASPFLNTGPDARYVGSDACRECHGGRHDSFRETGMGRSMAAAAADLAPPDAAFDHPASKRRYQVFRKDGRLWHRESLLADGPDVVLAEYPVSFVVGSGRHSLTYLVEAEGFLVESPVSWYAAKKAWGMSPGYDAPDQPGFERAAGEGCLFCHAGRAEAAGASLHRMHVTEPAITCERCHGPGSLHAELRHVAGGPPSGEADFTIVNPSRLPRGLAEAVCQQCHLRSSAMILAPGRKLSDFRPGLPLEDFVHPFMVERPDRPMTVVGHVEQLHLSRCYQASESLTCLTCHDPHGEPRPEDATAHYQAACLGCHRPEACKVAPDRRRRESPGNDCVQCHMPRSPTEVPHLAFTHHRIAVHDRPAAPAARTPGEGALRPFLDLSRLTDADRKRSLGLGYLEAANREKEPALAADDRERALELMDDARAAGVRDAALDVGLARLLFDLGEGGVQRHAEEALTHPELAGQDRCTALFLLADAQSARGHHAKAATALRELTRLRRHSTDWLLLADCERALGNPAAADAALETAVRINPRLWKVHQYRAEQGARRGDADRAAWHRQRAVP